MVTLVLVLTAAIHFMFQEKQKENKENCPLSLLSSKWLFIVTCKAGVCRELINYRCLEDCEERVLELDALLVCQANNVRLMLNPKFDSSLGWVHRVFDTISWHNRCPQDTMSITLCNNNISHPLHWVIVTIGRRKEQSIVRNHLLLNIFNIYYYYYYHHHNNSNRYWQYLMKYLRKVNTQTMMNHSSLWMCCLTKLN